jgi:hypothetical protein
MMNIGIKVMQFFVVILVMIPMTSYEDQANGNLKIEFMYGGTHDLADYHGVALKIYDVDTGLLAQKIDSLSENPFLISLPVNHNYKIKVYANNMFANDDYVNGGDLQNNKDAHIIYLPSTGSVRLIAFYSDGDTPVTGATTMIKSNDGAYQYWTNSTTDDAGTSIRYWLQPTILEDQYYNATFIVDNSLSYTFSPIRILASQSVDEKVVIPWPPVLDPLNVLVYKSPSQTVSTSDGTFIAKLYDYNGNKISESPTDIRGHATFSNLKVGSYFCHVVNNINKVDKEWGSSKIVLDGKQNTLQIFKAKYIPAWVKKISEMASDGHITEKQLEVVVMYLYQKNIIIN